ncbi:thioredoxin domain-containing protein [Myxosarcina sp. GI1]|uniref:DsbA family protein n=1 Tax=Myxosarcina sp. GI1 TaxID=1541065 RepID=UPI00056CAB75|nr:thioredoxin domain-containing protein [Myxosarcina sp. GI1]
MPIPIPNKPSGYRLGNTDAPVMVEMFFDLECPFSKKGWNTLIKVVEQYRDRVYFILQPMTLGNHRQSWDATKAAIAVAGDDTDKFIDFVSYIYRHQEEFANEASKDKTQRDFHHLLASYAADGFGWDKQQFIDRLESKEIYNLARIPARLAIVRGVWSTPTFFINGAEATDLSSQSSLEDWQQTIDSLLS